VFEDLGAAVWADRARAETRRIGGRQPQADGLTETELRVAMLAASGSSNKQIASELFMAVGTVEGHFPASTASSASAHERPSRGVFRTPRCDALGARAAELLGTIDTVGEEELLLCVPLVTVRAMAAPA
jgi:FixJ family two-component response regulator